MYYGDVFVKITFSFFHVRGRIFQCLLDGVLVTLVTTKLIGIIKHSTGPTRWIKKKSSIICPFVGFKLSQTVLYIKYMDSTPVSPVKLFDMSQIVTIPNYQIIFTSFPNLIRRKFLAFLVVPPTLYCTSKYDILHDIQSLLLITRVFKFFCLSRIYLIYTRYILILMCLK